MYKVLKHTCFAIIVLLLATPTQCINYHPTDTVDFYKLTKFTFLIYSRVGHKISRFQE